MVVQQVDTAVVPDVQMIGDVFVNHYYNVLHTDPQLLYKFYQDCSILGRPDPSGQILSVTTVDGINKLLISVDYRGIKVKTKTVDSQTSYNNGVLILVSGTIAFKTGGERTFTQSFFLAPQENGHFVLNDVVRYLDEEPLQKKQNFVEDAAQAYPVSEPVVNFEPIAQAQTQNSLIEQSTTVVEEPAPVVEEVHTNDMQQRENSRDSADQRGSEIEYVPNGGPLGPSPETPLVVQDEPKKSYASIVKESAAQPSVALKQPSLVRAIAASNPAQRPAVAAISRPPSSTPVNKTDNSTAKESGWSIFINDLPLNATLRQVEEKFMKFGAIKPSGIQVRNRQGGGSRYGFVEFEEAASVQAAVQASPILIAGRQVFVREKQPSANKSLNITPVNMTDKSIAKGSDKSIAKGSECSIFINNLPVNITPSQVKEELKKFGAIKPSGVQIRSKQGSGSSYGFVEFEEAASVQTAVQASPIPIGGRQVFVREKIPNANKSLSSTHVNMRDRTTAEGSGYSVFINNLPVDITPFQLEEQLKKFGAIKPSGVQVRSRQGAGSSYGFVEFEEAASVQTAIESSPILINGRRAFIQEKRTISIEGGYPSGNQGNGRSDSVNNRGGGRSLPGRAGAGGRQG